MSNHHTDLPEPHTSQITRANNLTCQSAGMQCQRTGILLFSFLIIAALRTVRGTAMGVDSVNVGQMNEQSPDLCICTLGLVGTMPLPPVFLCSPLSLPSATLTPTRFLHLPFSPFVSYLRIYMGAVLWCSRTVFCSCSKPPGPLLLHCFLCQLVPFVSSTSTYPGPTPSLPPWALPMSGVPFPNCV